jgi:hypothetical protein
LVSDLKKAISVINYSVFYRKVLLFDDNLRRIPDSGINMTHPFVEIEQQIRQLLPIVLVVPALVLTAAGLFVWLAGIRGLRLIAAFAAAAAGLLCAWQFTNHQLIPMVLFAVIPICISLFLPKPAVVLLGALLAGLLVLFVPLGLNTLNSLEVSDKQVSSASSEQLDFAKSIQKAEESITAFRQWIVEYCRTIPSGQKSIALMVAVGVLGAGLFSWRLICSAACSVLGTVLISCGMMLLLFYKGANPLFLLKQNAAMVGGVLLAMLIGGAAVQLWLCPKKTKKQVNPQTLAEGGQK